VAIAGALANFMLVVGLYFHIYELRPFIPFATDNGPLMREIVSTCEKLRLFVAECVF
jgi:siroheme synthase (precorrin-2 oxidase/ferrochelatase)